MFWFVSSERAHNQWKTRFIVLRYVQAERVSKRETSMASAAPRRPRQSRRSARTVSWRRQRRSQARSRGGQRWRRQGRAQARPAAVRGLDHNTTPPPKTITSSSPQGATADTPGSGRTRPPQRGADGGACALLASRALLAADAPAVARGGPRQASLWCRWRPRVAVSGGSGHPWTRGHERRQTRVALRIPLSEHSCDGSCVKRVLSVLPHLVIDGRTEQVIHHLDRVEGGVTEVRVTAPVGLVTGGHASLQRTEERGGVSRYRLFGRVSVPTPYWQASRQRRRGSVGVSQLGRLRRMTTI